MGNKNCVCSSYWFNSSCQHVQIQTENINGFPTILCESPVGSNGKYVCLPKEQAKQAMYLALRMTVLVPKKAASLVTCFASGVVNVLPVGTEILDKFPFCIQQVENQIKRTVRDFNILKKSHFLKTPKKLKRYKQNFHKSELEIHLTFDKCIGRKKSFMEGVLSLQNNAPYTFVGHLNSNVSAVSSARCVRQTAQCCLTFPIVSQAFKLTGGRECIMFGTIPTLPSRHPPPLSLTPKCTHTFQFFAPPHIHPHIPFFQTDLLRTVRRNYTFYNKVIYCEFLKCITYRIKEALT